MNQNPITSTDSTGALMEIGRYYDIDQERCQFLGERSMMDIKTLLFKSPSEKTIVKGNNIHPTLSSSSVGGRRKSKSRRRKTKRRKSRKNKSRRRRR
jgi:hypothetical protein